jgi:hypothetical protein
MGAKKQEIPPMREVAENLRGGKVVAGSGYDVFSWTPGDARSGVPCTEVHLVLPVGEVRVASRLDSARALDELVGTLLQHRNDVWGAKQGGPS